MIRNITVIFIIWRFSFLAKSEIILILSRLHLFHLLTTLLGHVDMRLLHALLHKFCRKRLLTDWTTDSVNSPALVVSIWCPIASSD